MNSPSPPQLALPINAAFVGSSGGFGEAPALLSPHPPRPQHFGGGCRDALLNGFCSPPVPANSASSSSSSVAATGFFSPSPVTHPPTTMNSKSSSPAFNPKPTTKRQRQGTTQPSTVPLPAQNPPPTTANSRSGGGGGGAQASGAASGSRGGAGAGPEAGAGAGGCICGGAATLPFRNVFACQRCRQRKHKCDQELPTCQSCRKANVQCVGSDPITGAKFPRSYLYYLESRVNHLESLLTKHNIPFSPPENFADLPPFQSMAAAPHASPPPPAGPPTDPVMQSRGRSESLSSPVARKQESPETLDKQELDNLVSEFDLTSLVGSRWMGPTHSSKDLGMGGATTRGEAEPEVNEMRASFFGLQTKPAAPPAPFPSRLVAERLVNLYFEHANPQIPSLHRGEFAKVVDAIYAPVEGSDDGVSNYGYEGVGLGGTARERYLLNIVCAIGAGIFLTVPEGSSGSGSGTQKGPRKKQKTGSSQNHNDGPRQSEPESYHASAMSHLRALLSQKKRGLDELQAVLLLAGYALLRPVSPGLWYIVGVAVRLAVDLDLHYEDAETEAKASGSQGLKTKEEGNREWARDMRRRLWWCVYNLDRLVSTCVGRPSGIPDEVISTQFPSMLDDRYIHPDKGFIVPPSEEKEVSYKKISNHYTRLRLLQSEILQVLQQQSHSFASGADMHGEKHNYPDHHPFHLQTTYLQGFESLRDWHQDMDRRLAEWRKTAPKSRAETGVEFSPEFLELNYWQVKIMLYKPCLSIFAPLAGEGGASSGSGRSRAAEGGLGSGARPTDRKAEGEEQVCMVLAEAGRNVLRTYGKLHRAHQVNYTFLASLHLFMAGIPFLYAVWCSPLVRSRLPVGEVNSTILVATSVLGDLVDVCPPAGVFKDAFESYQARLHRKYASSGAKRGPALAIVPSGTHQIRPPVPLHRQPIEGEGEVEMEMPDQSVHQSAQPARLPHPPTPQQPASYASSTDPYSAAAAAAENLCREPTHADDTFTPLHSAYIPVSTPTHSSQEYYGISHSPTTPTEGMPSHDLSSAFAYSRQQQEQNMYARLYSGMYDPGPPSMAPHYAPPPPSSGSTPGREYFEMTQLAIPGAMMCEHGTYGEERDTSQVDPLALYFRGQGS